MTSAPYTGTAANEPLTPPWNVPGEGGYKYVTFSFTPPAGSAPGSLTGACNKDPIQHDDESINWEADSSTGMDEEGHHHHHTHHN